MKKRYSFFVKKLMKFSIKNYIMESFKELIMSGRMILGLIIGLAPAVAIAAFILKHPEASFEIKHVSNFYCMLGLLTAVLTALFLINRDFSTNVIFLINNSKRNRIAYVVANFMISIIIATVYAIIGIAACMISSEMGVPGELKTEFLCGFGINLVLLIPSYFLFCYVLLLLGAKSGLVYTLLTGSLLFLPNIFSNILPSMENNLLSKVIENFPLYFYPIYAGSNPMSATQYIIGLVCIVLAMIFVVKRSERYLT